MEAIKFYTQRKFVILSGAKYLFWDMFIEEDPSLRSG